MASYILRRLGQLIPTLVGITLAVFLLIKLTPGDPATAILGLQATPEEVARIRHALGLDQPWWIQYGRWAIGLLHGDLGISYQNGRPVAELIRQRLPATLELAVAAELLAVVIALPVGIYSALQPKSLRSQLVTTMALMGISLPEFWFGILLILLFSLYLGWVPASGYAPLSEGLTAHVKHLLLPAFTLALSNTAALVRYTRTAVIEALGQDYVRTARSKGLGERSIIWHHAFRNALIPIVTVIGLQTGFLLSGAVIVEQVFAWPGIGWLAVTAINQRDYPTVEGVVLLVALVFVLINLAVDILYTFIDPRIRYDGGEG